MVFTQQKLKERSSVIFLLYLNETFLLWWNYANLQLTFIFCFSCEVVITWSWSVKMKFCPVLTGSQQFYKLVINYVLRLHVEIFIPARWDHSFVLPGFGFVGTIFFQVVASACWAGWNFFKNFLQELASYDDESPLWGENF